MTEKQHIRAWARLERAQIPLTVVKDSSKTIFATVATLSYFIQATIVIGYFPFEKEVDCFEFLEQALKEKKKVFLPKFHLEKNEYGFCEIQSISEPFVPGKYGVLEPSSLDGWLPVEHFKGFDVLWIVPGLAFDKKNYRLGMGKGYYDRFLQEAKGAKVGVCFSWQRVDTVYPDSWDVPMDIVVSEL